MASYPTNTPDDASLYIALDNFGTTLNGAIDNSQTTITLSSVIGLPTVGILTIESEKIKYIGISGNDITGCTRGFSSTSAAAHGNGVAVFFNVLEEHHNVLKDEIIAVATDNRNTFSADLNDSVAPTNTASNLKERLDMIVTQIKNILGAADWKDAVVTALTGKKSIATGNAYRFETTGATGDLQETSVTASRAVATDANGLPTASSTTATELGYVNGVTSGIQGQLNSKVPKLVPTQSYSANHTVLSSDDHVLFLIDATAAARTITLPSASSVGSGFTCFIMKVDSSVNLVTIDGDGAETVGGLTTLDLRLKFSCIQVISNGTNFEIVGLSSHDIPDNFDVLIGKNTGWTGPAMNNNLARPIDFWWDDDKRRLHTRTILLTELGDPSECALRRAEGTYPDGTPAGVGSGVTIGLVHWTAAVSSDASFQGRSAQIYSRTTETITSTAAGGDLHLATTPNGTLSPVDRIVIENSGEVTQPYQSSFLAYKSSTSANVTGDGTSYDIIFDSEVYDQNSDYNNSTGVFTAPVAGRYLLTATVNLAGLSTADHTNARVRIVTSNRVYWNVTTDIPSSVSEQSFVVTCIADMDAGDTAYVNTPCDGSNKTIDVTGSSDSYTHFSGSLIN